MFLFNGRPTSGLTVVPRLPDDGYSGKFIIKSHSFTRGMLVCWYDRMVVSLVGQLISTADFEHHVFSEP
jgi:hypothetical protein